MTQTNKNTEDEIDVADGGEEGREESYYESSKEKQR